MISSGTVVVFSTIIYKYEILQVNDRRYTWDGSGKKVDILYGCLHSRSPEKSFLVFCILYFFCFRALKK